MMAYKYKRSVFLLLLTAAFALFAGLLLIEGQTKFLRRYIDDVVYDNRNHYLSCEELPALAKVEEVVAKYQDVIHRIEQVNPGFVGMEIDSSTCPGKADILFWYGTHHDRLTIEAVIGSETFYGIPYRFQNR